MKKPLYDYIAGTGGIGLGRLFKLEEDHTLGRCESRLAMLTDYRDFCKLHIILHYVAVFLRGEIPVFAIGCTGADEEGRGLKAEMEKAGINVSYVAEDAYNPTMYSICGQYPNGEGFNITANNSACKTVGPDDVNRFFAGYGSGGSGIVIAAPEVPLGTRIHMLEKGRERNCFNVAAVPEAEAGSFAEQGGAALADLMALNMDEARAFAYLAKGNDVKGNAIAEEEILNGCTNYLRSLNPEIAVIITLGRKGAFARYRDRFYRRDAADVAVLNTAGAGDCFLGTIVAAKALGIDLFPAAANSGKDYCAMDLGMAASGKKVTYRDTIDFSMNPESLKDFAREHGFFFSDEIQTAFFGCSRETPDKKIPGVKFIDKKIPGEKAHNYKNVNDQG